MGWLKIDWTSFARTLPWDPGLEGIHLRAHIPLRYDYGHIAIIFPRRDRLVEYDDR